jgi:hypothetical protein
LKAEIANLKAENANLNANLFFYKELYEAAVSYDSSGEEESAEEDEEDEEDDTVPQTRERQTLVSANILPKFALLSVRAAIEDSLFEKVNLSKDKAMELLLSDPLNSHLLSMDRNAYGSTREHITAYIKDTEDKIIDSVKIRNDLTHIDIPNANNYVVSWEMRVCNQEKEVERLKEYLEEFRKAAAVSADKYKLLQDRKEAVVADIEKMRKAKEVALVLKEVMEQLSNFHATPEHKRSTLPLGNISSEFDPVFKIFKEKCGLTDYASTNLTQRKLIAISRAATMLGLQYSPYFTSNAFSPLRLGKSSTAIQLREQICKAFKISKPRDNWNGNAAAASKSPKRKRENSSALAPAMKRGKNDDDARMEQFFGTKEGMSALLKSPELQKLVLGSPRFKRALTSSSKKRAPPKSGDGN